MEFEFIEMEVVDSTNEEAIRRLRKGIGFEGQVIMSQSQTKGKGRMNREWISSSGNLHLSLIIAPLSRISHEIGFCAGVALCKVLRNLSDLSQEIICKWPNDVLIRGRKVAGILQESYSCDDKRYVVLGLGVNISSHPPGIGGFGATSLLSEGISIDASRLGYDFCFSFRKYYGKFCDKGFSFIRSIWLNHSFACGQELILRLADDSYLEVFFVDLSVDGSLIVRDKDNHLRHLYAGDIYSYGKQ